MTYVSIYTRRHRVEAARGKIVYWQEKLVALEAELAEAEQIGEPPTCMDTLCTHHAKFRVNGTEEACTGHLPAALNAAGRGATVENWPWERSS